MSEPVLKRRPFDDPRRVARYLLLLLIPFAVLLHTCAERFDAPRDLPAFSFSRPSSWTYLTETQVKPADGRIRFSAASAAEALEQGHTAPLFALIKYPPPHTGINPMIGVNLAWETADEIPRPTAVLERSVADVQRRAEGRLELVEGLVATEVAGLPAARVVLATRGPPAPGKVEDKLTVIAVLAGRLSLLIAASGAFDGADAVDQQLDAFAASLTIESQ